MTTNIPTRLPPEEGAARVQTITHKLKTSETGLRSGVFLHLDFLGERGSATITGVRLSQKGKDGSGLDQLFSALGDAITAVILECINTPPDKPDGLRIVRDE
jgi:hypothetical protein